MIESEYVIKTKGLTKIYKEKKALDELSFNIEKGEIFGFLGPNGAGKTTTIKILTSQIKQTSGDCEVFGKSPLNFTDETIKNIGVVTDNCGLYERLSIYDNLLFYARLYEVKIDEVDKILKRVNLLDEKNKIVKKLSKGMRQRVVLARAFLHSPKLIFLDEPTSGLDPSNALYIHDLIKEANSQGTTVFLTTHNMEEADKLCHKVAFINDGKIVANDTPENLKLKHSENKIEVLLKGEENKRIINNDSSSSELLKNWMDEGKIRAIHSNEPSLEDIFIKFTGRGLQ